MFRRGELALCSMIACADSANNRSAAEFSIPRPGGPYVNQTVVAAPQNSSFVNHYVTIPGQSEYASLLHNAASRDLGNLHDTRFVNAAPFNAFTNQMLGMPQPEYRVIPAPHTLRDMNDAASITNPLSRMLSCDNSTISHERGFGNRHTIRPTNFDLRADQALFCLPPQRLLPMLPPGLQSSSVVSSSLENMGLREQVAMNGNNGHHSILNMIDPQMHPNAIRFASNEAAHQYHFVPGAGLQDSSTVAANWSAYESSDGTENFHNSSTGESTCARPQSSIALDPPPPSYPQPTIPVLNGILSSINHSQVRRFEQVNLRNRE